MALEICCCIRFICTGFTFLPDMASAPPLPPPNSPFTPPIFFTTWANLVYCVINSCTSLDDTPAPRATRWYRDGFLENVFAPSFESSSSYSNNTQNQNYNSIKTQVNWRVFHNLITFYSFIQSYILFLIYGVQKQGFTKKCFRAFPLGLTRRWAPASQSLNLAFFFHLVQRTQVCPETSPR